jgi:hypothetical protein
VQEVPSVRLGLSENDTLVGLFFGE